MARIRISTTVDERLLKAARNTSGLKDAALVDLALKRLLEAERRTEIDAEYGAYDETPLNTQDEWGDLESFLSTLDGAA